MSLSCSCGDGDFAWYFTGPDDYSTLQTKRRKRCCSCGDLIAIGAIDTEFVRWRSPVTDIEERIYGDEVPLATHHMCEECSDLYFSLKELGFCISLTGESMQEMVNDYHNMYGTKKPTEMEAAA